jgi:membrane protein
MFEAFKIPISWTELFKRTGRATMEDDVMGLSAQLAYYFFLALFPAILFLLALASFFPLDNVVDQLVSGLRGVVPAEVVALLQQQIQNLSEQRSGGLLTLGVLGALWSSSAALVAVVGALNRAYDLEESRPWWKVRLTAMLLTIALAAFILVSFALVIVGPMLAEWIAARAGLGAVFEWTWKILQWPVVFFLVSTGIGLLYYFAPDAEQEWVWISPAALLATSLWLVASLGFRFYVVNFGEYNETYGAIGAVILLMLWFYLSGFAILVGAELSAEIERASPHAKVPDERAPGERKKIGVAAARAYEARRRRRPGGEALSEPGRFHGEGGVASAAGRHRPAWVEYLLAVPLAAYAIWARLRGRNVRN